MRVRGALKWMLLIAMATSACLLTAQEPPADPGEQPAATADRTETTDTAEATETTQDPVPDYDEALEADQTLRRDLDLGPAVFRSIGGLLVVLGLLFVLAWLAKRFLPRQLVGGQSGGHLKLLQSLPVGTRKHISLVEADGRRYLVGVTEQQINLLASLDEPGFDAAMAELEPEAPRTVREMMEGDS